MEMLTGELPEPLGPSMKLIVVSGKAGTQVMVDICQSPR